MPTSLYGPQLDAMKTPKSFGSSGVGRPPPVGLVHHEEAFAAWFQVVGQWVEGWLQ